MPDGYRGYITRIIGISLAVSHFPVRGGDAYDYMDCLVILGVISLCLSWGGACCY
jgi:hypothetical protein